MILEKETYEKFGYYPSDLKPQSNKTVLATCDECGKVRETNKNGYRSLCKSCVSKKRIGKKAPNWRGGKVKRICKQSGKEFTVVPSKVKNARGIFYSRKCQGKWRSENIRGNKSYGWKGGKIIRICEECGKEFPFRPSPSKIKSGRGMFCSRRCARKAQKMPTHHTKPELIFEQICKKYSLPFKYTGDGTFWIKNINPDFIGCKGKKIAVEIFGDYWHSPLIRRQNIPYSQTYKGRNKILKKYGWKLIIFWESDLLRSDAESFILSQLNKVLK